MIAHVKIAWHTQLKVWKWREIAEVVGLAVAIPVYGRSTGAYDL